MLAKAYRNLADHHMMIINRPHSGAVQGCDVCGGDVLGYASSHEDEAGFGLRR